MIFAIIKIKNDEKKNDTQQVQTEEKTETPVEPDIKEEVKPLFSDSEESKVVAPSKEERDNESNNNDVKTLLTKLGININSISEEKIKKVMENYDEELITKNIESLKAHNINLEILIDNTELVYDKELNEKIEKLISIGKESRDISLMPSVLVKYDLKGLNNTINVLQISGLDPKKVPLMAY